MFFKKLEIKSRNIDLIYLSSVIGGMLFFLPILALYFEESLFTATSVALIFSIEAVAMTLFEIPTGAIADLFGRKNTIILAHFTALAALIFLYIGGGMAMFILYGILNSFARSLNSGTASAFIYDTLKDEGKEHYYKKVIGTMYALWPIGASVGSLIGGYLAVVSLSFPVLIAFIPVLIAFILTLFLKEPKYEKEEHRNIIKHMFESSKFIIKNNQLVILLIGSFLLLAFGETLHLLSPLFYKFKELPLVYFGYVGAFIFGLSSAGHYLSNDISEKLGNKATLILCAIGTPILIIIATILSGYSAVLMFIIPSVFFGLRNPVMDHLLNLEVSSSKRATILSFSNFMGYLGIAIFSPFIGYLGEVYTINTAFMISALLLFIVPVLFFFLTERN